MFPHSRRAALALTCLVITATLGATAPSPPPEPAPAASSRSNMDKLADILRILMGDDKDAAAQPESPTKPDSGEVPAPEFGDRAQPDIVPATDAAASSAAASHDEEPFGELWDEGFKAIRIPTPPPPGQAVRTRCRVESSSCRMREYAESGRRCRCGQLQGRIVN